MAFTNAEIKEIRDKLKLLEEFEEQRDLDAINVLKAEALAWWNTIKPRVPTTRQQAIDAYRFIKNQLTIETDRYRLGILRTKLEEAETKYKERKLNG